MLNFVFALGLSTVLLEALLLFGSHNLSVFYLMQDHGMLIAVLLYAVVLYLLCIRKQLLKDRKEYRISTQLGHCGELLEFDKTKFPTAKRKPWDHILCLWAGVRTYHTDTSTLFTTQRGKFFIPTKRIIAAVLCIIVLFYPLALPHHLNQINAKRGQTQYEQGKSNTSEVYPMMKEYDGVLSIAKLTDKLFQKDNTDTAEPQPQQPEQTTDTTDNTDTNTSADNGSDSGFFAKIGSFFTGFFKNKNADSAEYLLPSDSRELTEDDVSGLSRDDIQLRINEMYARHGYAFSNNPSIAEYFSQYDWYSPDDALTQDEVYAQFSELEKQNRNFLIAHRD